MDHVQHVDGGPEARPCHLSFADAQTLCSQAETCGVTAILAPFCTEATAAICVPKLCPGQRNWRRPAQDLGADEVVDYKSVRFEQRFRSAPFDVVVDTIGGASDCHGSLFMLASGLRQPPDPAQRSSRSLGPGQYYKILLELAVVRRRK